MIRVVTFADQDAARVAVSDLAARAVQDILYLLDSATGPDGGDTFDAPPDPETSRLYKAFREWFGPQIGASIQGLVVGPLLSRLGVDEDGRAYIEDQAVATYRPEGAREISRARWLCEEIPSLVDTYGELLEGEAEPCLADVSTAVALLGEYDTSEPESRAPLSKAVSALLPKLEEWFMFSNRGARLMRGHRPTVEAFLASLGDVEARVKVLEAEHRQAMDVVAGNDEGEAVSREALQFDLERTEQTIARLERRLESLDDRRERIIDEMSAMV